MVSNRDLCQKNALEPMKWNAFLLAAAGTLCLAFTSPAATRYVDVNNHTPEYPYTGWGTAATNIQDAVDAAAAGEDIVVTNGVYQTGTRAVSGMNNRLAVTKTVTVRSVNGPAATMIVGAQEPGTTNGPTAVRCVYLADGAVLSGFTLTNGATMSGGDWAQLSGGAIWCESTNGFVSDCVLAGNSAYGRGAGTYGGTLNNCTLTGNVAGRGEGAGAYSAVLNNCTLRGNSALDGGGASSSTLSNCLLVANSAVNYGGGVFECTLMDCSLGENRCSRVGGGASGSMLTNCVLTRNSSLRDGGGAYSGTLINCTVTGNSALQKAGGVFGSVLSNSIVYYNTAPCGANYYHELGELNYCCTIPLPALGVGNTAAEPQLASASHLSAGSPCRGAGNSAYASGVDIDGEQWANPPAIGCDEYRPGSVTGPLSVEMLASYTNVAVGFAVDFQAVIGGRVSASRWDFGDGTVVSNRPYASHAWVVPGDYAVELRAYSESYPGGVAGNVTVHVAAQPVYYVSLSSPSPVPPYTNWLTAATNIQDAVDAAALPGALVLVTNGVYGAGARAIQGMSNRVAVTRSLVVQSVNGPDVTTVVGYRVPSTTNGPAAIRCVYLTNGALLSGFTLTNGATQTSRTSDALDAGGGVWCEGPSAVVTNCVLTGNSAYDYGGGAYRGMLDNCILTGNRVLVGQGGGADHCTLNDCLVAGNSAYNYGGGVAYGDLDSCLLSNDFSRSFGGGASHSALRNCTLQGNIAYYWAGGGAYRSSLDNCTLTGNDGAIGGGASLSVLNNCTVRGNYGVMSGGGADGGTLNNCILAENVSGWDGGGASAGRLNNCAVTGNSAAWWGGGASGGSLNNCTLTHNSAGDYGGGTAYGATVRNCIVYYNTAPYDENFSGTNLNYCCTTPMPSLGTDNITAEPQLVDAWHVGVSSPCRGAGSAAYSSGVDIDREPWATPPSIGCDEYWSGSVTGTLSATIVASCTTVGVGFAVEFQASVQGRPSALRWDFGDGVVVGNQPQTSHAWAAAGDYTVELRAYNETYPGGVATSVTIHVVQPVHYVALDSPSPVPPYTNWLTAATNIQDAVDAAVVPGSVVLVSNGVYQAGARAVYGMSNRVAVTRPVTVQSLNGPGVTCIRGYRVPGTNCGPEAVRCVYLTSGAVLAGFTVTNGATQAAGDSYKQQSGGGVWCESADAMVMNCVLVGNTAMQLGGGAFQGTLNNCMLTGNSAIGTSGSGGGTALADLNNCTVTGNSASSTGGGVDDGVVNNCIIYYNSSPGSLNSSADYSRYCCTTPLPSSGTGNIAADPQLASLSHISANSPCRGAGGAAYASGTDLDGEGWANPPSIGCDEYWSGSVTGALSSAILTSATAVQVGFPINFQALIDGRVSGSRWVFSDGVVVSNQPYTSRTWVVPGVYPVELWAYNEDHPTSVVATVMCYVNQAVHYVDAACLTPVAPYTNWATAATNIQDAVDAAVVADIVVVTNGTYETGGRAVSGMTNRVAVTQAITVRSVNGPEVTRIDGYQVPLTTNGPAAVRCVYLAGGALLSGFTLTNGATQQGSSDVSRSGGGVFCTASSAIVTNCVLTGNSAYTYGGGAFSGTLLNCTLTGNSGSEGGGAAQSSLSGCALTGNSAISRGGGTASGTVTSCTLTGNRAGSQGGGVYQGTVNACTLAGNTSGDSGGGAYSATLSNCTLTNNSAWYYGGGARSGTLNGCVLAGNSARYSGGGAYGASLNNCVLAGNWATNSGGGTSSGNLYNCTLVGNWSGGSGGGSDIGALNNCINYYNSAPNYANCYGGTLRNSCTIPLPTGATGSITNAPLFVDTNAWNNLRLQSNSPCINAGLNSLAPLGSDLDGNTRIVGGAVDIGAYECQAPALLDYYTWLQSYGLSTAASALYADSDSDRMNNWDEWRAGTDPTNAISTLRMLSVAGAVSGLTVTWASVTNRFYSLERAIDPAALPAFALAQSNIAGLPEATSWTDTNAGGAGPFYYRVRAEN